MAGRASSRIATRPAARAARPSPPAARRTYGAPQRARSSAASPAASRRPRPRRRAMEAREIAVHGHRFAYRTAGSGPVVLLVHGMARSSETWREIVPWLADGYRVIAPDLLGHGLSAKPTTDYSVGAHACCLRDLLVALGHDSERVAVVGHSFGGGVAMQFAYQFPERCDRMVLVASGGLGRDVHPILRALAVPGAEWVVELAAAAGIRSSVESVASALARLGLRASAEIEEVWD